MSVRAGVGAYLEAVDVEKVKSLVGNAVTASCEPTRRIELLHFFFQLFHTVYPEICPLQEVRHPATVKGYFILLSFPYALSMSATLILCV